MSINRAIVVIGRSFLEKLLYRSDLKRNARPASWALFSTIHPGGA
jgi:hypothetical protein